uniref:Transmembrane protein n=1 Tax=Cacopsylla melanoneura TaxID=428564 RepID=A0A8D8WWW1_9HEMI
MKRMGGREKRRQGQWIGRKWRGWEGEREKTKKREKKIDMPRSEILRQRNNTIQTCDNLLFLLVSFFVLLLLPSSSSFSYFSFLSFLCFYNPILSLSHTHSLFLFLLAFSLYIKLCF